VKRPLRPDEASLWGVVTATIRPSQRRRREPEPAAPLPVQAEAPKHPPKFVKPPKARPAAGPPPAPTARPAPPPGLIEPGRKRRLVRERDDLGARLDLHGLDQDAARLALQGFLLRAQADGLRAVLVITGKGSLGDGVLRKRAPDWLSEPILRPVVAGVSEAHRRHGGAGALYVALKRRSP